LVIEDHTLVREGMVQAMLGLVEVGEVVEAEDAESAWKILSKRGKFDLVLLDLMLPGMDGLSFVGMLRARYPSLPVLVVSALVDRQVIGQALRRGIAGFVPKSSSSQSLLDAVRVVLGGGTVRRGLSSPIPMQDAGDVVKGGLTKFEQFGLTSAQARVLDLLADGKTNREIAEGLGLAEGTVKLHVSAIFRALNVRNRAQALLAVARTGQRL
jgi:DNA-binding NarL/FixJ family response regulator